MMVIHFGTKLYGKVDVVPGYGFVATKFFHVMLIPLFPLGCWYVVEGSEGRNQDGSESWEGVGIPFSAKSVLFAYGRVAFLVAAGFLAIMAIPVIGESMHREWVAAIGAVACIASVVLSYPLSRASQARAVDLVERYGYPSDAVRDLYRRPPA